MSSDIRRLIWNTRERALSTDLNDGASLMHRALIEAAVALSSGDVRQGGVLKGLQVTILGGGLNIVVNEGLAVRTSTAPTAFDSETEWIEVRNGVVVDLAASVDPVSPRWVAIEIAENDSLEISSARDIFDPITGTFVTQDVEKVRGSEPTIVVNAGAPAADPLFPNGVSGRIPLAYIYIEAAAATLNSDDIVHCRPLLGAVGVSQNSNGEDKGEFQGGGVSVVHEAGKNGVAPNNAPAATFQPMEMHGRLPGHNFGFRLPTSPSKVSDPDNPDENYTIGASFYSLDGVFPLFDEEQVYVWITAPPYPLGYDGTLAKREFIPKGTVVGGGSGAISRFPSGTVMDGTENCILITSQYGIIKPDARDGGRGRGIGGSTGYSLGPFGTVSIDAENHYWVGSVFTVDAPSLVKQNVQGGRVYPALHNGTTAPYAGVVDQTIYPLHNSILDNASAIRWPETATGFWLVVTNIIEAGDGFEINITDPQPASSLNEWASIGSYIIVNEGIIFNSNDYYNQKVWNIVDPDALEITYTIDITGIPTTIGFSIFDYRDQVLEQRSMGNR